jgi:hypothetical protein
MEMSLGFSNVTVKTGGDILPIIKYDAKAGDFIRVDRHQVADGSWDKTEAELALPLTLHMDFANIEVGWLSFANGAPDFAMVKIGQPLPDKPTPDHKQAFRLRIWSEELGLREFSGSSKTLLRVVDALHDDYMSSDKREGDHVVKVEATGTETVKVNTPQGELRFKAPKFEISDIVARPAGMSGNAEPSAPAPASSDEALF